MYNICIIQYIFVSCDCTCWDIFIQIHIAGVIVLLFTGL